MSISCPSHGTKYIEPAVLVKTDPLTGESYEHLNARAGQCSLCVSINDNRGRGKSQPVREKRLDSSEEYTYSGEFDIEDYRRWLKRIFDDPDRLAAFLADGRRPAGTNRRAYGVAIRKSIREPMLSANPEQVRGGLKSEIKAKPQTVKSGEFKRIKVKPKSLGAARLGGGWHTREWIVYTLRYAKGLVIVTDKGEESSVFPSWHAMRESIIKSHWEILGRGA